MTSLRHKIKLKIAAPRIFLVCLLTMSLVFGGASAEAASCNPQTDGTCAACDNGGANCVPSTPDIAACEANPTIKGCSSEPAADCSRSGCDLIQKYVNPLIDTLSGIFGLVAVISIIIGGIQYTASEGDPQKATQAKNRIGKTVFAIMAYFFLFAFLQFIVPGGIFNRSS